MKSRLPQLLALAVILNLLILVSPQNTVPLHAQGLDVTVAMHQAPLFNGSHPVTGNRMHSPVASATSAGLVGWWAFDAGTISGTTVLDWSGAGNNGTASGNPSQQPGVCDQSLRFNGTNWITVAGSTSTVITGSFTIEAWVNLLETGWEKNILWKSDNRPWRDPYFMFIDGTDAGVGYDDNSNVRHQVRANISSYISAGFFHLAGVFDADNHKLILYANGTKLNEQVATQAPMTDQSGMVIWIGGVPPDASHNINGSLDELRLYNRALTQAEIAADMQQCGPLYSISGQVTGAIDNSGVTISDNAGHSTTTDGNGNYTLSGLTASTYTITPSKSGYTFSPASRNVPVPPDATGQDFQATLDIGFLPNPNGYKFQNYYDTSTSDLTIDAMRAMFNDSVVCKSVNNNQCTPWPKADQWRRDAINAMTGGHCDGMAVTSLRFFKGIDNVSSFQNGASVTHDLDKVNVRNLIAKYWSLQTVKTNESARSAALAKTPTETLNTITSSLASGAGDPLVMHMYKSSKNGLLWGHTVTPYGVQAIGNGIYHVLVYDNGYHDDNAARYVEIDTTADSGNGTWTFDGGFIGTLTGDASTKSLAVTPISKYSQYDPNVDCPWCPVPSSAQFVSNASENQVWLNGGGHLLITNSSGQHIGYEGDQFVNEIAGASSFVMTGGSGIPVEPIYSIPGADTYTTLVDGQTLTSTVTASLSQYGPNYVIGFDNLALNPTDHDQIQLSADGTTLDYTASSAKSPTFRMAQDVGADSYEFQLSNVGIGSGQSVGMNTDTGNGKLEFSNAYAGGSTYDVAVTRVTAAGAQTFGHNGVTISATDTQYYDYGTWDGVSPIKLEIDHGSDGTIDQTVDLTNQDCTVKPVKSAVTKPKNGSTVTKKKVLLDWNDTNCATTYNIVVRVGSKKGTKVQEQTGLTLSQFKTKRLASGKTYYWRVQACNSIGCTNSKWWHFLVK